MTRFTAPNMPQQPHATARQTERRQIRVLLLLTLVILIFSLLRVGIHTVSTPGWWRLW
ncbi:MAG TPA: hypothetical protein VNU92_08985 [Edaphobacter sp.]|nr:hypothetical protein [Edaphobacter sp.]